MRRCIIIKNIYISKTAMLAAKDEFFTLFHRYLHFKYFFINYPATSTWVGIE